jgi:hypothetical protein
MVETQQDSGQRLCHSCHRPFEQSIAANGQMTQLLRQSEQDAPPNALLIIAMIVEGSIDLIMLGTDGARRSLWSSLGGSPGLAWLYSGWSKKLIELGLTQGQLDKVFIDNPARTLTLDVQSLEMSRGH